MKYTDPSGEYTTRYEDEEKRLLLETDDGNDATVVVANEDVSNFIEETLEYVVEGTIDDVKSNQQLIDRFGQNMHWQNIDGVNVPNWAKSSMGYTVNEYFIEGHNGGDYGSNWGNFKSRFNATSESLQGTPQNNYNPPPAVKFTLDLMLPVAIGNAVSSISKGETLWGRPVGPFERTMAVVSVVSPFRNSFTYTKGAVAWRTAKRVPGAIKDARYSDE